MADKSKIAWTDSTFNPWLGCTKVSAGCAHCYAESQMDLRYGKVKWGPSGTRVKTSVQNWNKPLKWNREAAKSGQRHLVFCASLADICEQWDGPILDHHGNEIAGLTMNLLRAELVRLIRATPNLTWLCLTKREESIHLILPLPNIWMGVTVEGGETDHRWKDNLAHMPEYAKRWISYEPALSRLPIENWNEVPDWIIFGGESDQHEKARPFKLDWLDRGLVQCRERGIVPFVKQMGDHLVLPNDRFSEWPNEGDGLIDMNPDYQPRFQGEDMAVRLATSSGSDPSEWPERFRIREFPA